MNQKKKRIIIAFVILNLILIPWIMIHNDFDIEKVLKYSKELALVEFAIISLIIAVSVFDQFGLNKKLTEKKVELIIELLTELKNQKGFGSNYYIKGKFFSNPAFYFGKNMAKLYSERLSKMDSDFASMLHSKFAMDGNDFDEAFKKVKKVLNHPLMPKVIVEKAQFLKISGGIGGKVVQEANEMIYLYFTDDAKQRLIKEERDRWFFAGNNDCTFLEFLTKFDELFNACEEWTNLHSNINEKLNLEEFQ